MFYHREKPGHFKLINAYILPLKNVLILLLHSTNYSVQVLPSLSLGNISLLIFLFGSAGKWSSHIILTFQHSNKLLTAY